MQNNEGSCESAIGWIQGSKRRGTTPEPDASTDDEDLDDNGTGALTLRGDFAWTYELVTKYKYVEELEFEDNDLPPKIVRLPFFDANIRSDNNGI